MIPNPEGAILGAPAGSDLHPAGIAVRGSFWGLEGPAGGTPRGAGAAEQRGAHSGQRLSVYVFPIVVCLPLLYRRRSIVIQ